ncbi:hypothetical protein VZT92_026802 [Zoarces viviparus]|uniref:Uncharacterized protein n=1 Tax=Zoarces viviparus TaxID=48416 RepID=A0AAW1DS67_ZOAVI
MREGEHKKKEPPAGSRQPQHREVEMDLCSVVCWTREECRRWNGKTSNMLKHTRCSLANRHFSLLQEPTGQILHHDGKERRRATGHSSVSRQHLNHNTSSGSEGDVVGLRRPCISSPTPRLQRMLWAGHPTMLPKSGWSNIPMARNISTLKE